MMENKEEVKKTNERKPRIPRFTYKMVENDEWEYGFKVFRVTEENRELLDGVPTVALSKASDLEEGDEVIVSFKDGERAVYGIGEITSVDYVGRIPFTVFMTGRSSAPDESFRVHKESIRHKIVKHTTGIGNNG